MNDPRENCPWKCKHCLCYEGEIERMREALEKLAKLPCGELDTLAGCLAAVHIIAGAALCNAGRVCQGRAPTG